MPSKSASFNEYFISGVVKMASSGLENTACCSIVLMPATFFVSIALRALCNKASPSKMTCFLRNSNAYFGLISEGWFYRLLRWEAKSIRGLPPFLYSFLFVVDSWSAGSGKITLQLLLQLRRQSEFDLLSLPSKPSPRSIDLDHNMSSEIKNELQNYLESKNINALFVSIVEQILVDKPDSAFFSFSFVLSSIKSNLHDLSVSFSFSLSS